MATRDSFNIDYKAVTPQQKEMALNYVRLAKPTAVVVMDGPGYAKQIHDAGGGDTISIYRRYGPPDRGWDEGYLWRHRSPQAFAEYATEGFTLSKDVWVYVLNEPWAEPHEIPTLVDWVIETTQILIDRGYRAVSFNLGPGTVQPWHLETGLWDKAIRKFSEWSNRRDSNGNWRPLALFGMHEYTGFLLPFGVGYIGTEDLKNPANVHPDRWPKSAPVRKLDEAHVVDGRPTRYPKYWHINRGPAWFQLRAADIGVPMFYIVLTEFGLDRMPDMTTAMPNIYEWAQNVYGANGHDVIRGPDSYANVWRHWWPFWSFAEALHAQSHWVNKIYNEYVLGWTWFTFSHADDWDRQYGFNLAKHPNFWNMLIANPTRPPATVKPQPQIPQITSLQDPLPSDSDRWIPGTAMPKGNAGVNIRYAPTTSNNTPFAVLRSISRVRIAYRDGSDWAYIEHAGKQGYIYMPLIEFTPDPPEEETVDTLPVPAILRSTSAIVLRSQPNGTKIRSIRDGEFVEWFPNVVREAGGYKWVEVRHGTTYGWMALVWPTWEEQFLPVPKPSNDDFWLYYPVGFEAIITGRFGDSRNYGKHEGVDWAPITPNLDSYPVRAARMGVVTKVGSQPTGYGEYVRIDHGVINGSRWITWYGHLKAGSITVREGDLVDVGQVIGDAGSTGNSTGVHLHLTLQKIPGGKDGYVVDSVVDPLPYIYYVLPDEIEEPVLPEEPEEPEEPETPECPEPDPTPEILKLIEVTENLGTAIKEVNEAFARLETVLREAQEYLDVLENLSEKFD